MFHFQLWKSIFSSGHRVHSENLRQVQSKQYIIPHICEKNATKYKKNMRRKNWMDWMSLGLQKWFSIIFAWAFLSLILGFSWDRGYLINFNKSTPSWITVKRNLKNQFVPALNSICEYFQHIVTNVDLKFMFYF